jgi:hypothetical protein
MLLGPVALRHAAGFAANAADAASILMHEADASSSSSGSKPAQVPTVMQRECMFLIITLHNV